MIGLEVHAQIVSQAKLFSGAATEFGAEPNTQVSPVDAAFPGMLPVINRHCVEQAVKDSGSASTRREINLIERLRPPRTTSIPICPPAIRFRNSICSPVVGAMAGSCSTCPTARRAEDQAITRLHLEQDAGKSLHDQHPSLTYVDLNRAGVGLMEIVSEPDLRSAEEAGIYLRKLRSLLRYLGTCDGNMDEGSMRCDVNVSVRRPGEPYGTRCEIKNVNSVRYVMQAIEYEARRQVELLEAGGRVAQQTRLFDVARGVTRPMRSKEEAHDYRYFPDPDLLPLVLDPAWVEGLRVALPELPDVKKARFVSALGLPPDDAAVLVAEQATALFFERVAAGRDANAAANWVTGDLFAALNRLGIGIEQSPVSPEQLGALIDLIANGTISGRLAKDVFAEMAATGADPAAIVEKKGLRQVTDETAIAAAIDAVLAREADKVAEYQAGRDKLYGFFVGQIMRATQGKANPALVNQLLKQKLIS